MAQVAIDAFVVFTKLRTGGDPEMRREMGIRTARELDDRLYGESTTLFHAIYRSHKPTGPRKPENGFNPIRDGLQANKEKRIEKEDVRLVEEIQELIKKYGRWRLVEINTKFPGE